MSKTPVRQVPPADVAEIRRKVDAFFTVSAEEPRYYRILFNWSDFGAAPKAPVPGSQNVLFTIDPDTLPYTDVMMQLSLGAQLRFASTTAVADFIVMAVSASLRRQDRPGHEDGGFLFRVALSTRRFVCNPTTVYHATESVHRAALASRALSAYDS
jgi:hypothetical protein